MNFKRFLSSALAIATVVSSLTVTNVFAGDPTFKVGKPVDITTNAEVTEFTAGQIVEVPIDIENVDSGKISMAQLEIYYDNTIFEAGALAKNALSYYNTNKDYIAVSNGKLIGRHNMKFDELGIGIPSATGAFSGNTTASAGSMTMLWTITGADSIDVNADELEFGLLFTVKSDYDPDSLNLNYGTNTLNNEGLFALDGIKVDETTTNNHRNITGTQNDVKVNQCYGAFEVSIDNEALVSQNIYVSEINANVYKDAGKSDLLGTTPLTVYTNEEGSVVYGFPTRVIANSNGLDSAYVEIVATLSDKDGNSKDITKLLATKTISMNGSVTNYESTEVASESN